MTLHLIGLKATAGLCLPEFGEVYSIQSWLDPNLQDPKLEIYVKIIIRSLGETLDLELLEQSDTSLVA